MSGSTAARGSKRGLLGCVALAYILACAASPVAAGGATPVRFRFRAPESARTVSVAGTFNGWNTSAALLADPDGDHVWECELLLDRGTHQYKFVVDSTRWFTDETATAFADDGFGGRNSVLEVGDAALDAGEPASAAAAPSGTPITFRFRPRDKNVNAVSVAGSFNDWNAAAHILTDADGDGVWEIVLHLAPGSYAYQFVVDGDRWTTDPAAARYADDGFGGRNALLEVATEPIVTGPR